MCSATSGGQACPVVAMGNAVVLRVFPFKKKKKVVYIYTVSACSLEDELGLDCAGYKHSVGKHKIEATFHK